MIVVIGLPLAAPLGKALVPAGTAVATAIAAVRAGASVQLVGKLGDDPAGDAVLVALARAGVGHVALLRDPSRPTPALLRADDDAPSLDAAVAPDDPAERVEPAEVAARPALDPADVELGLRYLTDFRAIILAEPMAAGIVDVAAAAAGYAGAELILVAATSSGATFPPSALVLEAPPTDPDGAFATLLGEIGAAVDAGQGAAAALDAVAGRLGAARTS